MRIKLSKGQQRKISEILENTSVAWFSAGIVSPSFVHPTTLIEFLQTVGISLAMTAAFFAMSIYFAQGE